MEILLASKSPRRQELLQSLGYQFKVVSIDCDEAFGPEIPAHEVATYIAELKAKAFGKVPDGQVLITADTVVVHQNQILGKPTDAAHATQMLQQLSGTQHQVYTACTLSTSTKSISFCDVAEVTLAPLSDAEIAYYIQHQPPFDKAGSYGVQDWLGMSKITQIQGSYYTIMGLPTHLLYQHLQALCPALSPF
jgi:septum formation protein